MRYCKYCGKMIGDDMLVCQECERRLHMNGTGNKQTMSQNKNMPPICIVSIVVALLIIVVLVVVLFLNSQNNENPMATTQQEASKLAETTTEVQMETTSEAQTETAENTNDEKPEEKNIAKNGIYTNDRFGYRLLIPDSFTKSGQESDNGDGAYFYDENGAKLTVSGSYNVSYDTPESIVASYSQTSYSHAGEKYCCVSYLEGSDIVYRAFRFDEDIIYSFEIIYPENIKTEYDDMIKEMLNFLIDGNIQSQEVSQGRTRTGKLTEDEAYQGIVNYCYAQNPDLSNMSSDTYSFYWTVDRVTEQEIVILFRSYTAARIYYHVDPVSGDVYTTVSGVPGYEYEEGPGDERFNIFDFL